MKLDDDTKQVLQDCQAYLMEDDPIQFPVPDQLNHRRSGSRDKTSHDRPSNGRRHSFKNAIVPDPTTGDDMDASLRYLPSTVDRSL